MEFQATLDSIEAVVDDTEAMVDDQEVNDDNEINDTNRNGKYIQISIKLNAIQSRVTGKGSVNI